ncbi:MBL fold metallo-hydrolase [Oceanotoga teriensis]|uniref:Glyoxylase-like metal-dependent hydrolase (Beta-lactamase superfamily II) n=1 Tax=Oceanotoga teriensis TaxID=515440 RepID=A0AA45C904_9BACT|nr:MBL fold metallo-hydrolase [Oceanotoga teriensis]MDO7977607.1 MBL fold metallo-hydrolase [Oceanotoga teriensis]PWJ96456.1 glyoxylase-like metal-dependent hydrolase (beta-lactamase superfamily II) [Oceanotoga teriensis]
MSKISINKKVGFFTGDTNLGYVKNNNEIILIDTGCNRKTTNFVCNFIKENNLNLIAIINTHSHADHCGENYYYREIFNPIIYADEKESIFIENPQLKVNSQFLGANAPNRIKNKFVFSNPCTVDIKLSSDIKKIKVKDFEFELIRNEGHSYGHLSILYDNVIFGGDLVISEEILNKHKLSFYINIDSLIEGLNLIKNYSNYLYVPSHGNIIKDLHKTVDLNINRIKDINDIIINIFINNKNKLSFEELYKKIFEKLNLKNSTPTEYYFNITTINAHISSLINNKKIKIIMDNLIKLKAGDNLC